MRRRTATRKTSAGSRMHGLTTLPTLRGLSFAWCMWRFNYALRIPSRRAYDALNVLTAMDIISKDKKDIQWKGFPPMVLPWPSISIPRSCDNSLAHQATLCACWGRARLVGPVMRVASLQRFA